MGTIFQTEVYSLYFASQSVSPAGPSHIIPYPVKKTLIGACLGCCLAAMGLLRSPMEAHHG